MSSGRSLGKQRQRSDQGRLDWRADSLQLLVEGQTLLMDQHWGSFKDCDPAIKNTYCCPCRTLSTWLHPTTHKALGDISLGLQEHSCPPVRASGE